MPTPLHKLVRFSPLSSSNSYELEFSKNTDIPQSFIIFYLMRKTTLFLQAGKGRNR